MRPVPIVAYLPAGVMALILSTLADTSANDFFQFWFAGHLVATGRSPYDQATWVTAHEAFGALAETVRINCPRPDAPACLWTYPPWTAWLLIPFGALPVAFGLAAEKAAFTLLLAGGTLAAVRAVGIDGHWTRGAVAAGALSSAPFVRDLVAGHFEGALLIGLVLVPAAIRRGDPLALGAAALLLGTKPHLFLGLGGIVVAILIARRQARLLLATTILVGSVAVIAVLAEPRFLAAVAQAPAKSGLTVSSTWTFAEQAFASGTPVALLIIAASACAAAAFVLQSAGDRLWPMISAGMALSLTVSPYVQSYDHVLLLPCLATAVARARRFGWPVVALIIVAFAAVSWWAYLLELGGSLVAFAALLPAMTLTAAAAVPAIAARAARRTRT